MSTPVPPGSGAWAPRAGYRRHGYRPAAPGADASAGGAGGPGAPRAAGREWTPQVMRIRRRGVVATWVVACTGILGFTAVLWVIYVTAGEVSRMVLPFVLALVPLFIVLVAVCWIDRWEPEPVGLLVAAFLWGAGVSTVISLVVNTSTAALISQATGDPDGGSTISAVVAAPVSEELTKGLGVLVVFLIWRRSFNGAVDGIVYAAVIAAGFAFAENILYFVQYSDMIVQTFILRGLISPFAHVTFTACTGIAVGASARMRSRLAWIWMTPLGLACAILLHAFWNGVLTGAPALYFFVEVPFFLACIGLVVWLRRSERMTMRNRLADYQRAGWFGAAEVTMLTTGSGRSAARRWSKARGPRAQRAMRDFLAAAAALAQLRQQAIDGHAEADFSLHERELLDTVTVSRRVFTG